MSPYIFNAGQNRQFTFSSTDHKLRGIGLYDHSGSSGSSGSSQGTGPSHNLRDDDPLETYYRSLPMSDGSFLASESGSPQISSQTQSPCDQYPGQTMRLLTEFFTPVDSTKYGSTYRSSER